MNEAAIEQATKEIIGICLALPSPDDACTVLAAAMQLIACMAEENRDGALKRNATTLLHIQRQLAINYDAYMWALKRAEKDLGVVAWLDGEPPRKNKSDKTKH